MAEFRPDRVLCFGAHPDDIDFGAAGTVAGWTAAGVEVSYCIMTDGDAGGFVDADREGVSAVRHDEQLSAAALAGVSDVHFLGLRDGFLTADLDVVREVVRVIRRVKPDVVLSLHPERNWHRIQKSHPDHLACGEAVTRAVYPACENPFAFPELAAAGLEAHKVSQLWFYAGPSELENHASDITDHAETKLEAVRVHASQHPDFERTDAVIRSMLRDNARRFGLPEGTSAELFQVVGVNTAGTIAGF